MESMITHTFNEYDRAALARRLPWLRMLPFLLIGLALAESALVIHGYLAHKRITVSVIFPVAYAAIAVLEFKRIKRRERLVREGE